MTDATIAILIPTLNEENVLARALIAVRSQMDKRMRLIVADGGSSDGTRETARQQGALVIETSRRGRGCQIAEALTQIHEDVVVIVHADMVLLPDSCARIRRWLGEHKQCPGGCLGHRFASTRWTYRLVEWWDRRRALRGISYGDQGQFFRREWIEHSGGFPQQPIMEDLELSRRLRVLGTPAYLDYPAQVSPRRFERLGWLRTISTNFLLRLTYRIGGQTACHKLYRRYYSFVGELR